MHLAYSGCRRPNRSANDVMSLAFALVRLCLDSDSVAVVRDSSCKAAENCTRVFTVLSCNFIIIPSLCHHHPSLSHTHRQQQQQQQPTIRRNTSSSLIKTHRTQCNYAIHITIQTNILQCLAFELYEKTVYFINYEILLLL